MYHFTNGKKSSYRHCNWPIRKIAFCKSKWQRIEFSISRRGCFNRFLFDKGVTKIAPQYWTNVVKGLCRRPPQQYYLNNGIYKHTNWQLMSKFHAFKFPTLFITCLNRNKSCNGKIGLPWSEEFWFGKTRRSNNIIIPVSW